MGQSQTSKLIASEIQKLKKEKNAVVLAHYYEEGDIQDVADFVGDSYYLAQMGQKTTADIILLAGVVFMAESVKILNPKKTVIVPSLEAGCSLVDSAPADKYLAWRKKFPRGIAVTYINSSAEVKAISDVIITSSNAEKIVNSIPKDRPILFGPDENLGRYLSQKLGRQFELWPGTCEVHMLFNSKKLGELIQKNPDARVIAHPECTPDVLQYAQVIGSTSRLLEEVKNHPAKKFIVATEPGIFHQMKKARPDVEIIQAPQADGSCGCNNCPYMKQNTLEKVLRALQTVQPEITMTEQLRAKAQIPLDRMMAIANDQPVDWPSEFRP
ncbi:MAG: quinolinate synthase A [Oligoflexia bacterium]|nr:MAG: quinolinate synthase A [Oligoflexia bacterium]